MSNEVYEVPRIYKRVLQQISDNRERRLRGDSVTIPWSLPRISEVLPGIEKARYNLVSAPPKGGKTQITDFLFMYEPLEWYRKNPDKGISLKIFYFSLEISKEAKLRSAISHKLMRDYGVIMSPQKLMSVYQKYILEEKIKRIIESKDFIGWLDYLESIVEFNDTAKTPYDIFRIVQNYAESHGRWQKKRVSYMDDDGILAHKEVNDVYIPNDPNEFVIIIVDHISLLEPDLATDNLHKTIGRYSSKFCLHMRDKWGYIPVVVQQQSASSSEFEAAKLTGNIVFEKVKPSPEGLADNKYTSRDVDLMLSLFHPAKYDLKKYKEWDLTRMYDSHRELTVNLNRNGISRFNCQMYFNGATSYFEELPKFPAELSYQKIKSIEEKTI